MLLKCYQEEKILDEKTILNIAMKRIIVSTLDIVVNCYEMYMHHNLSAVKEKFQ